MDKKRALEDGGGPTSKRPRSDLPSAGSSAGNLANDEVAKAALIAQKRAEIAAKIAAMNAKKPGAVVSAPPTGMPAKPAAGIPGLPSNDELARRVAEAKKRVAEAQIRVQTPVNPHTQKKKGSGAPTPDPAPQGAGLSMAAHPLLLDQTPSVPQSKKDKYKPMQPKFATIKANIRNMPATPPVSSTPVHAVPIQASSNPYASASAAAAAEQEGSGPRERVGRAFRFNQKGKYSALGDQLRKDAQLEELKKRIAENARKAGLDSEFDTAEKNIKRDAPPEAEWWDAALLPNKTYADLSLGMQALNIHTTDSPITVYVQHPIPIPAPGEKDKSTLKPLKLTTREQKKLRKGRRQAAHQDHQDRVRMGLEPPDPPKVRLANLMKVLTSDAIQDPTKVEARVRREVAIRKHNHEKMNTERKLTDDQRHEKIETKKVEEEKKGIYGAVFRVKNLSDPAQRFKVRKNAEQLKLTGVCLFNPSFTLVYVEGAIRFVRKYKHLMTNRIVWTEAARARGGDDVEIDEGEGEGGTKAAGAEDGSSSKPPGGTGEGDDEGGEPQNLEDNRCDLVWEGQLRDRAFGNFKPKACPTDHLARETLGPKLHGYWDMARNFKPVEDDFF